MNALDVVGKFKSNELVFMYNKHTPNPVRKFTDRHTAEKRVAKVMEENFVTIDQVLEYDEISKETKEKIMKLKTKATAKAEKKPKGERATRAKDKDKKIYKLVDESPYRKGSAREGSFNRIKNGMTIDECRQAGVKRIDINFGIENNHYELKE